MVHKLDVSLPGVRGQTFTQVDREWPISSRSWSSLHNQRHNQDGEIPLEMAGAGARDMTPMERWMKESGKESPWNNVGSYSLTGTKDKSGKDKGKSWKHDNF
jgi:hypothetical protein